MTELQSSRSLLTTPLFSVEHRKYTTSDGGTFARDIIIHPGAVVILPVLDDGRIVLIRNLRYTVGRELLELPAGTREPDESPIGTAHRELIEETGYRAARMDPLVEFYASPGILTERMYVFIARGLVAEKQSLQQSEQITVVTFDVPAIHRLLISGEIEDGKTIAALGTYLLRHSPILTTGA